MTEKAQIRKHIFLDSMMYMHFRPVDEVDWPAIVGADNVVLVVPRITVQELDKNKNVHRSRRVRDRIRRFLTQLEKWTRADKPRVREHIALCYLPLWPSIDLSKLGLDSQSADDMLIAAIVDYRKSTPEEVLLISDDSTPRLTAHHLGLAAISPPLHLRLADEPTDSEKEIQTLRKQIQRMAHPMPVLSAQFAGEQAGLKHMKIVLPCPLPFPEEESKEAIESLRREHPHHHMPEPPKPKPLPKKNTLAALAARIEAEHKVGGLHGVTAISADEYTRANRDIDTYISQYKVYLKQRWQWENARRRTIRIVLEILNDGTTPAEDVDVSFHFPDGLRIWGDDVLPQKPRAPTEPAPPQTPMQKTAFRIAPKNLASVRLGAFSNPITASSFHIKRTNSYLVTDKFSRIKHGDVATLKTLFVEFDTFDDAASFGIDYRLRPANMPDPVEGRLHVVVSKQDDSSDADEKTDDCLAP